MDDATAKKVPVFATTSVMILKKILEKIDKINFRDLAIEYSDNILDKALKQKHYLICVVDVVLKLANENDMGICQHNSQTYLFNGCFWNLVPINSMKDFLGEAALKMGVDKFDAKFHLFKENLFKQFMSSANLPTPERRPGVTLINLINGTYEITESVARMREFIKEDFITYQLPFLFEPEAGAVLFHAYLDRVLPDKSRQLVLAEFFGYIFTQGLKLEKCLLLYGTGANGKSVFFDIINALIGKENISNCSMSDMNKEYNRALLASKLLNYGSEVKGNAESDIFKQLVSGEPIQACMKYRDPFIMTDYAKICFNCNELPRDVEHTEAYFRRFLIVPFDITIPEKDRDPRLARKIIATELPGVFNWIMEGLKRLLEQENFSECNAINDQISIYKAQNDSVIQFLENEGYDSSVIDFRLIPAIYPEYRSFCQGDGYKPLGKSNFKKRLASNGFVIERKNIGWVVYIAK
jgi:putative DNA primase/helicase